MTTAPLSLVACSVVLALTAASAQAAAPDLRLVEAVKAQDHTAIRSLIPRADVGVREPDGTTAMHWAAYWDDRDTVSLLIRAGADVNARNELGATPLWLAASEGRAPMVDQLLRAGAKPNVALALGETPLMAAARAGSVESIKLLIARGADVNAKEQARGQTALMWAVAGRHPAVVRTLLEVGATLSARSNTRTMLVNTGKDGLTRLSEDYTDFYEENQGGFTPLLFAVRQGDVECARLLLDAGASVEDATPNGASALVLATHSGRWPMASMLLKRGANPNAAEAGYTALHAALVRDNNEFAKTLIARGADVNARIAKSTPVRRFAQDFAVDPNWIGANAFWLAARFVDAPLMRYLVASGANPLVTSRTGATALIAAATGARRSGGRQSVADVEKTVVEAAQVALELGIDTNATDTAGDTALHVASARRLNSVAEFLVQKGAAVSGRNRESATPLSLASIDYSTWTAVQLGYVKYRAMRSDGSTASLLRRLGAVE